MRPSEPKEDDLSFTLSRDFIKADEFLVDDIRVGEERHMMFATAAQLSHLQTARRWFIDGTFKVVRRPFYQLMSVHAFVKSGEHVKQVPLVFVLMSRRRKEDYVEVFSRLKEKLGDPMVEWFMLDYEAAAWQAIRQTFPNTIVKGCVFHWLQRVYRKVIHTFLRST
ncbi:uncharacterized protein LOC132727853 [Ruditapes philippinarum]|uniref:uncharacterized protein LOC132727853 n=1 Tax=Ruditapes philippinarum TaxID=129788 RepID=UPI00295AECD7|nr:uncharacterized protein LOC132727853 [Ruditapes philippinarum]